MERHEIEAELKIRFNIDDRAKINFYVDLVRTMARLAEVKYNGDKNEVEKAARKQLELLAEYI